MKDSLCIIHFPSFAIRDHQAQGDQRGHEAPLEHQGRQEMREMLDQTVDPDVQ